MLADISDDNAYMLSKTTLTSHKKKAGWQLLQKDDTLEENEAKGKTRNR